MFRTDRLQAITLLDERYPARRVTLRRRWLAIMDARKTNDIEMEHEMQGVGVLVR